MTFEGVWLWAISEWLNLLSLFWFAACWLGYSEYARHKAPHTECLALVMHHHRIDWMKQVVSREMRVQDASIIANLERNVAFMASTSMLVLAGLVTVLARSGDLYELLAILPFVNNTSPAVIQLKLLVLSGIFVYAFFTFTWSLRQFGFGGVLVGAMPYKERSELSEEECNRYAESAGKVLDKAAHSYNFGLRSYYFAMALFCWFINPLLFMAAVTLVVWILYRREFHSGTLKALLQVSADWHAGSEKLARKKDEALEKQSHDKQQENGE
ncbi:MAG: DUF599 domain-containing protein [Candidatus Pelagadaptatus aseana]|uniref:DUF599 domain-containing protein n=1 Tax=Candidatus Pelagadaptatus aseana TaxID=3120508 RepID=UPI0039B2A35F